MSLLEFVSNAGRRGALADPPPTIAELRGAVAEVILRRTKEMVLNDLPQRVTRDVYVDLGPDQRRAYDRAERDGVVHLDDLGASISIEHVFKLIGQLKQICNFDPATGEMYDDLVVITTPTEVEKHALVEDESTPFFTIDHFRGYAAVLVQQSRLSEIGRDELEEIITDAWAASAPKRLVREHLGG